MKHGKIMKKISALFLILSLIFNTLMLSGCKEKELQKFTDYSFDYFDTVTTIIGYAESREEFSKNCDEIKDKIAEYHRLFDIYNTYEGINNLASLNQTFDGEHKELQVDERIIDLLLFSKEMYRLTDGYVNIAAGSVLSIWHTYRTRGLIDPQNASLPELADLKKASKHTDIDDIIINEEKSTVFLKDSALSLDVGAIAKGYAVQKIGEFMKEKGFSSYILNIGGNVKTLDKTPQGEDWKVGIENPNKEDTKNPYKEVLEISNLSLVTSGNYQRFYTVDGKNYNHIINLDTLYPAENYASVSVLCEDSALADCLSTALFCMDIDDGKKLIKSLKNVECLWIKADGEKIYSDNFKNYCNKEN